MICKVLKRIYTPWGYRGGGGKKQGIGNREYLPHFADCFHCAPGKWNSLHEVAEGMMKSQILSCESSFLGG